MKKLCALVLIACLVMGMSCILAVSAAPATFTAKKGTPTVDGQLDEAYKSSTVINIDQILEQNDSVTADTPATGKAYVLWDKTNLYFFVEVNDDTKVDNKGFGYNVDCVEIFVDFDNNKSTTDSLLRDYDSWAAQLRFQRNPDDFITGYRSDNLGAGTKFDIYRDSGYKVAGNSTTYSVEACIPHYNLPLSSTIGLSIQIQDSVDKGAAAPKRTCTALINKDQNDAHTQTAHYSNLKLDGFTPVASRPANTTPPPESTPAGTTSEIYVGIASSTPQTSVSTVESSAPSEPIQGPIGDVSSTEGQAAPVNSDTSPQEDNDDATTTIRGGNADKSNTGMIVAIAISAVIVVAAGAVVIILMKKRTPKV